MGKSLNGILFLYIYILFFLLIFNFIFKWSSY